MKFNISGLNFKTMMALVMFSVIWFSNAALAATHDIHLSANTLPNVQYAFKMEKHTSSDGTSPLYPAEATIPGPTVFVKKGDVLNVTLTNNIQLASGAQFKVGLAPGSMEVAYGDTRSYTYTASDVGTVVYGDESSHLLGLFGALILRGSSIPQDPKKP